MALEKSDEVPSLPEDPTDRVDTLDTLEARCLSDLGMRIKVKILSLLEFDVDRPLSDQDFERSMQEILSIVGRLGMKIGSIRINAGSMEGSTLDEALYLRSVMQKEGDPEESYPVLSGGGAIG